MIMLAWYCFCGWRYYLWFFIGNCFCKDLVQFEPEYSRLAEIR